MSENREEREQKSPKEGEEGAELGRGGAASSAAGSSCPALRQPSPSRALSCIWLFHPFFPPVKACNYRHQVRRLSLLSGDSSSQNCEW